MSESETIEDSLASNVGGLRHRDDFTHARGKGVERASAGSRRNPLSPRPCKQLVNQLDRAVATLHDLTAAEAGTASIGLHDPETETVCLPMADRVLEPLSRHSRRARPSEVPPRQPIHPQRCQQSGISRGRHPQKHAHRHPTPPPVAPRLPAPRHHTFSGVTLGMTCATTPSGPMTNVARRAPQYLRPYLDILQGRGRFQAGLTARRRRGSPRVLHRQHGHNAATLVMLVDDHEPRPRPKHVSRAGPSAAERWAKLGKPPERSQPPCDAQRRVRRQLMSQDQLAKVLDGRRGNTDLRHLQLVEPDRLAASSLLAAKLHPLPRTWNAVEHGRDLRRLPLQLRQRVRKKRHRQIVLLRMRALRQGRQPRSRRVIEVETDLTSHAIRVPSKTAESTAHDWSGTTARGRIMSA